MPPHRFESEVESFLEGSHGDRTHIKRADHPRLHHYAGHYSRGKRAGVDPKEASDGLIPAHAGKTFVIAVNLLLNWAHPRSRGENAGAKFVSAAADGSSPLTRGKLGVRWIGCALVGLIPAHAGKT